jgi:hypothetical protein
MSVPVTFCAQAEEERERDKSNDAPFVSSENEALPQRLKLQTPTSLQFVDLSLTLGRMCTERYFPLMLKS